MYVSFGTGVPKVDMAWKPMPETLLEKSNVIAPVNRSRKRACPGANDPFQEHGDAGHCTTMSPMPKPGKFTVTVSLTLLEGLPDSVKLAPPKIQLPAPSNPQFKPGAVTPAPV